MDDFTLTPWLVALALVAFPDAGADTEPGPRIAHAALAQVGVTTSYDPAYVKLRYPGGDVPLSTGVCTDVVIRALRAVGIDLQREVYESRAGAPGRDRNIDHRRVVNLMRWFEARRWGRPITRDAANYLPGDVVAWKLPNGRLHVGIVVSAFEGKSEPTVVHNIAEGAQNEAVLFAWKVIGHYRAR